MGLFISLLLPLAGYLCCPESSVIPGEFRRPATFTTTDLNLSIKGISVTKAPQNLEHYVSVHFGFRKYYVYAYLYIKYKILGVDPIPERVITGKDEWLFLGDDWSGALSEALGFSIFNQKELALLTTRIANLLNYCNDRNILFYLAIAPEKNNTCKNLLPIPVFRDTTKLGQLIATASLNNLPVLNLGEDFQGLEPRSLYYQYDSHWNEYGAFLGYRTLSQAIRADLPGLRELKEQDFTIDFKTKSNADLSRFLHLDRSEEIPDLTPKFRLHAKPAKKKIPIPRQCWAGPESYEKRYVNPEGRYKALIFRDSYFDGMILFFSESFAESVLIWDRFDTSLIDSENPDIIIFEIAEREIEGIIISRI